jgi:Cu2+-exporting ATPase
LTDSSRPVPNPFKAVAPADCFHCGLPVPSGTAWRSELLGAARDFCCAGCRAVAEAIRDGGLEAYYELRSAPAAPPAAKAPSRVFDREDLQETFVRAAGSYSEARLHLQGIRCEACLWVNERRLRAVPGVIEASVGYADHCATVRWDPARVRLSEILAAIEEVGYRARPVDPAHRVDIDAETSHRSAARLLFAGIVGMMVMNLALAAYFAGGPVVSGRLPLWEVFARWMELAGTAALLAFPGQEFFAGAWRDLTHRRAGMDVPIALGLAAGWAGSAWATVRGGPVYFDAIAMLVFFVLLARALQTRARLRAAAAMDRFAVVEPATVLRLGKEGVEEEVPALELQPGNRIRIRPGETVAADGIVVEGRSAFDEAVLTGEPWPRRRGPGDIVVAGSVNGDRPVLLEVTRAGDASSLSEIRRIVQRGLASRPPIADLTDRLAGVLTGVVLLCAAATAVFWATRDPSQVLPATIAVLIVTCPCALAVAAPAVLTLAAGRLLKIGVLPVRLAALEPLARAKVGAFDKTGTLTTGMPRLESVETVGMDGASAVSIAAALERESRHPIAAAIREATDCADEAEEIASDGEGRGIEGKIRTTRWRIGSPRYVWGDAAPLALGPALMRARSSGHLTAALGNGQGSAALFTFSEELRAGALEIAPELRAEGFDLLALLSGDARAAVETFAAGLGFDEVSGERTSSSKLAWVAAQRGKGRRVLFVGDGWNDAATLAAADVSVSLGEAPFFSRLASDFLILGEDLAAVAAARAIARRSLRLLRQNVGWALGYNILIVPLAAAGLVAPWAAALAMSASSLAVVANALRLFGSKSGEESRGRTRVAGLPETPGSVHPVGSDPQVIG